MAINKSNSDTWKLMADIQLKKDLSEAEKKRYSDMLEMLDRMPGGKIRSQIQYIQKNLLPAVEGKRGGKTSADYKFFESLVASLQWALVLYDRADFMMRENSLVKLERTVLLERLNRTEFELQKFTNLEDMYMRELFDVYDKAVRDKLKSDLEGK